MIIAHPHLVLDALSRGWWLLGGTPTQLTSIIGYWHDEELKDVDWVGIKYASPVTGPAIGFAPADEDP